MTSRIFALACFGLMGHALTTGPARADAPTIKNASLTFATGDDGKEAASVLTVTIANAGGTILERVLDNGLELRPETSLTIWLQKSRAETADRLQGSRITVSLRPKTEDRWTVKEARLLVNFDSGPAETWHWGPFVLETRNSLPSTVEFALTDDHH